MSKEVRTPYLRFKGFRDDWRQVLLISISNKVTDGTHDTPKPVSKGVPYVTAIHVRDGSIDFENAYFLTQEDHDQIYKRCNPEFGDLLIVNIGAGTATCALVTVKYEFSLKNVALVKPNSSVVHSEYLAQYQRKNTKHLFTKLTSGGAQPFLSLKELGRLKIDLPVIGEQKKIASFLSAVDEKIRQLKRRKELLELYKKGVMQQLFSGKLRFKDEKGREYPKWEEKSLFDVSEDVSYGMNAAATEFDGLHKYIRITDIDESSSRFSPNPLTSPSGEIEERFRLKKNDLVFARTGASVGKAYLYDPSDGNLYYAGFLIKFSVTKANAYFIFLLTQRGEYNKWVHVHSMRSGQPGLNAEEYKSLKIQLPCIDEQGRIADCLLALGTKIQAIDGQVMKVQLFKKGLLQQMFV